MKKLLFIICLVASCASTEEQVTDRSERGGSFLARELDYYKDTRTGICYSGTYVASAVGYFTSVSCTPEVENAAHKFKSGSSK